jgi:hypothetical protein
MVEGGIPVKIFGVFAGVLVAGSVFMLYAIGTAANYNRV